MSTIQSVKEVTADIAALQKLLKSMNPASGVAIAMRRGVARDDDDVEDDQIRRPWTTVEVSDMALAHTAISAVLIAAQSSLAFRLKNLRDEHHQVSAFLTGLDAPSK